MLLLFVACSSFTVMAADWPQYGGPKRDFITSGPAFQLTEERLWRKPFGPGTSGIVSDGTSLFTLYSMPNPKKASEGEEVVVALNPKTGETLWKHSYPVARLQGQESYTGEAIRPQATPAITGNRLCTLGYTGQLKGLDTKSGEVKWQFDLVKEFEATPVQFGFSASPLVLGEIFIVHVGGKQVGNLAIQASDGKILWKSKPTAPSYSSPVLMGEAIVQMTRDGILGLSVKDGSELWSYPLPKLGLTNVPTPIVLSPSKLLISGQGVVGTRLLEVSADFKVKELWKNEKQQFFYANWAVGEGFVVGTVGQFFCALDTQTGQELWRNRGQIDANVLRVGEQLLILSGQGKLTRAEINKTELRVLDQLELLKGRCWTPPTLIDGVLYARSEKEITAIRLKKS